MRKHLSLFALVVLGGFALSLSAAEEKGDKSKNKTPVVTDVKVKGRLPFNRRGSVKRPTVVRNAKALDDAIADKAIAEQVKKQVNFRKQDLLVFSWGGSGQDKLTARIASEEGKGKIAFEYQAGFTRDFRPHSHLFAIRKGAKWEVVSKRR